ncbi:MAG: restriction endonuclease subunit S [Verrucomicrobiota bacterium]|nr:restriction endonuclease subunit S [Verrucomicrobiota bacterium]
MMALAQRAFVVRFKDLDKWRVPRAGPIPATLPKGWRVARVGDFAQQITDCVRVEAGKPYKMFGVKWCGEGVFLRETAQGDSMSAAWVTPAKPGMFIYNRLFAWKESFAVVPSEFADCFVSGEFPQFTVDAAQVSAEYLDLLFRLRSVIRAVNAASAGSAAVSRNRFKEVEFLRMELPLPPLETQRAILAEWKKAKAKIDEAHRKVKRFREECDVGLLKRLGLLVDDPGPRRGAFCLASRELERWDAFFYRADFVSLDQRLRLMNAIPLGKLLQFSTRPWKPTDFPTVSFEYVEISNVTKEEGIVGSHSVECEKAPSRATTLIGTGDILISTTRPYLGAFARVPQEYDRCVCSSGFAMADRLASNEVDPEYVILFLKSAAGLRQMERRMTGGLYPAIVQSELERVLVPSPPISTQRKVVEDEEAVRARIAREREAARQTARRIEADLEAWLWGAKEVPHA